ncbi:phage tail domain-containing protein [Peribacillus frigoritolerans]|uniref:phage tail domain-containing protein n=1 Tax=Peribacillus frigoritolerans TaxID=450367 RepID=UPI003314DC25
MQKLIYTNSRGDSVTIGHNPPFQLASIEGLGDLDADIQTNKAAYQDGSTYLDTLLNERNISIGVRIKGDSIEELFELRRKIASVFNPKFGLGELRYEYPSGVKVIKAVADHVPSFPSGKSNHGPTFQRSMITLICPDPYWRDIESISKPMSAIEPRFSFPLKFPMEFGTEGSKQVYDNIGDVPAPVLIEFRGSRNKSKGYK